MSTAKARLPSPSPWILVCWKIPNVVEYQCRRYPLYHKDEAMEFANKLSDIQGYDVWVHEAKCIKHLGIETEQGMTP